MVDDEISKLKRLIYALSQVPIDAMVDSLEDFDRQVLVDLARKILAKALSGEASSSSGRPQKQKPIALTDEDICARLRSKKELMLTKELARILRYDPETIYRWIKFKKLPATRFRGEKIWKYDGPKVADWWEEGTRK